MISRLIIKIKIALYRRGEFKKRLKAAKKAIKREIENVS